MQKGIERRLRVTLTASQWNKLFCAMHAARDAMNEKGMDCIARDYQTLNDAIHAQIEDKVIACFDYDFPEDCRVRA